eukprot:6184398-Pleurochrysis_carterae.AAC.1
MATRRYQIVVPLLCRPHLLRYHLLLHRIIPHGGLPNESFRQCSERVEREIWLPRFSDCHRVFAIGREVVLSPRRPTLALSPTHGSYQGKHGGGFRGAASAGPTQLLTVELPPRWAHGFHGQRLPPYTSTIINSGHNETLNLA